MTRVLWLVRQAAARKRRASISATIALIAGVIALALLARWSGAFLGALLSARPMVEVLRSAGVGVALLAIVTLASAVRDVSLVSLAAEISSGVRQRMLASLIRRPASRERTTSGGESVTRFATDVTLLHQSLVRVLAIWLPSVVTSVVLVVALFWSSLPLALATIAFVAPTLLIVGRSGRRLQGAVRLTQENTTALGAAIADSLAGIREAKVFRREQALEARFDDMLAESVRRVVREERAAVAHPALTTFASAIALTALVLAAAWMRRSGAISNVEVTRYLVVLALLVGPLQEAIRSSSALTRVRTLLARCDEVIDEERELDRPDAVALVRPQGGCSVSLARALVKHATSTFVLGPLTLDVARGETIVVRGASGSGKSTLLELIPRLTSLTSGEVSVEGTGVQDLTLSTLRGACAFVPQEPFFFAGSIRENLTFAQGNVSAAMIASAMRAAHVDTVVARLPGGIDAMLASGATNLSVGERQRLALARAMLVRPSILLLDEPTAALDPESERLVVDSLRRFTRKRTALIVTHSAALDSLAHRIVTLENGRLTRIECVREMCEDRVFDDDDVLANSA